MTKTSKRKNDEYTDRETNKRTKDVNAEGMYFFFKKIYIYLFIHILFNYFTLRMTTLYASYFAKQTITKCLLKAPK